MINSEWVDSLSAFVEGISARARSWKNYWNEQVESVDTAAGWLPWFRGGKKRGMVVGRFGKRRIRTCAATRPRHLVRRQYRKGMEIGAVVSTRRLKTTGGDFSMTSSFNFNSEKPSAILPPSQTGVAPHPRSNLNLRNRQEYIFTRSSRNERSKLSTIRERGALRRIRLVSFDSLAAFVEGRASENRLHSVPPGHRERSTNPGAPGRRRVRPRCTRRRSLSPPMHRRSPNFVIEASKANQRSSPRQWQHSEALLRL
jgi:hypothetical protein